MANFRPRAHIMLEQPLSSWMFKQPGFLAASAKWGLQRYLTYLGDFGHPLLKGTHLLSTLPTLVSIVRQATKKLKDKHREMVERRKRKARALGLPVPEFYHQDGNGKFHGGKDLASSAIYPQRFVSAVFKCWLKDRAQKTHDDRVLTVSLDH